MPWMRKKGSQISTGPSSPPTHGVATAEHKRRCGEDWGCPFTLSSFMKPWTGMKECPEIYQAPGRGQSSSEWVSRPGDLSWVGGGRCRLTSRMQAAGEWGASDMTRTEDQEPRVSSVVSCVNDPAMKTQDQKQTPLPPKSRWHKKLPNLECSWRGDLGGREHWIGKILTQNILKKKK